MTPARARELAAAASELYRQLREADAARRDDPDEGRRRAGWRIEEAAGGLQRAAEALLGTADELIRLAARRGDACPVPWGVCPEHGATLTSTGDRCWCTATGCARRWTYDRTGVPCSEPVTHRVVDAEGTTLVVCNGHALAASREMTGATVNPLI